MGNEASQLKGLEINEKAIEITDFWGHYRAKVLDSAAFFNLQAYGSISVFKSESIVPGLLWSNHSPLEKCAINLMKFRHPCIMRYILHWQSKGVHYLSTEPVRPLSQVLSTQDSLQVCVGLHQIAQALDFLHTKALQSHNNIGVSSVYVMPDGSWKLGGLEFLRPFSEMNISYLKQIRNYRYDRGMDEKEESYDDFKKIDQYAFCALVEDVFKSRSADDLPYLKEFKDYCKRELQNPAASLRIPFSILLNHMFFNHEFLSIHKFLTSLPVKSEGEKKLFFEGLLEKLRNFSEETVAIQLGGLLLSRLVLLNSTAREKLLPFLLLPKENNLTTSGEQSTTGLFSLTIFKHHVTPQLLRIFRVRDTQVRMLLLKHFSGFSTTFSEDELTAYILPELLLGIKDTDDSLVCMTLYCLADLIPILGASTVIGPKRTKIFSDGRPMVNSKLDNSVGVFKHTMAKHIVKNSIPFNDATPLKEYRQSSSHPVSLPFNNLISQDTFDSRESIEIEANPCLHERPSPDGGEDLDSELAKSQNITNNVIGSEDDWSDWEQEENAITGNSENVVLDFANENVSASDTSFLSSNNTKTEENPITQQNPYYESKISNKDQSFLQKAALDAKSKKLTDIFELDIKNQKFSTTKSTSNSKKDEFDFFTDMEPVIEKANIHAVDKITNMAEAILETEPNRLDILNENKISNKLNFTPMEINQAEISASAWNDLDWDGD